MKIISSAVLFILVFSSCTKEEVNPSNVNKKESIDKLVNLKSEYRPGNAAAFY